MAIDLERILTTKSLWVLANLVFSALLALQLGHVLEGYVNPTITRTWEKEVGLEEIDFPGNVYGDVLGEIQSLDKADINPKCTKAGKFKSCPQDLECAKVGYGKTGMNYD